MSRRLKTSLAVEEKRGIASRLNIDLLGNIKFSL